MVIRDKIAADTCDVYFVDENKVGAVQKLLESIVVFSELAELFKVLGDPTRIKIIYILSVEELCVCDIAGVLGLSVSAVSHQLRTLRNLKLVKFRREGKMAYYSLDDAHISQLFNQGLEHIKE
ncbi:MAG TPA: ArsR family transcriptional regulator [Actinobacteria bacterium]|nr:ArsR family transcriptional regulator [Actinomycetes bacterium]HEX21634.1 ArsR family transcriptional regulator [Actinomycetota bacterium]